MTWFHEWFGEEYLDLYSYRDDDEAKQQVAFFREHCGNVHGPLPDLACGKGLIERWFDLADRSFNKRMTIGQKRYLERVRGYDLDEISMMFTTAGLTIRAVFGDFLGAPFEKSSPRLILLGTKNR